MPCVAQQPASIGAKDPRYERWRWQIFLITWVAYAGFLLTRNSFLVSKIALAEPAGIGLTRSQMAWIDGAFLAAYAFGQFLWGVAGDQFGARRVVLAGMICSTVVAMSMGSCSGVWAFGVCFSLQGFCQSSGWAPLVKNVGNFFTRSERGVIYGLWCTNYTVGGLVASVYAGCVGQLWGWRFAFYVPALTLLGLSGLFYRFQRDRPEDVGLPPVEQARNAPLTVRHPSVPQEQEASWKRLLQVITTPVVARLSLVYFFLKPTRYALLFWGPKYLNEKLGTGMAESGLISALFDLAGPFSVLTAGWVSDKIFQTRRLPVAILSLALLGSLLLLLDHLPQSRWMLGAGWFLLGFLTYAPDSLICGVAAVDFGTRKAASTATGVINGVGALGATVGVSMAGLYQDRVGWQGVFTIFAGAVLVAALLLLPKWNARPAAGCES